jgi:hypothetical protein
MWRYEGLFEVTGKVNAGQFVLAWLLLPVL